MFPERFHIKLSWSLEGSAKFVFMLGWIVGSRAGRGVMR